MPDIAPVDAAPKPRQKEPAPALLFEMIRSFVTLASTLNLSHAVAQLSSTRQTVRRHIQQLEDTMGAALFSIENRRYSLTKVGIEALPEARDILDRGKLWLDGKTRHADGMLRLSHEEPNGWCFHQQQQPLSLIWDGGSPMLQAALQAWTQSQGELESEAFRAMRPYMLVYRDSPNGWICTEVGEKSFYTQWWGWSNARSSIGRPLKLFPGGPEFENMLNFPFREVEATYGVRLDEVVTQIPREEGGAPVPLAYKRLLMAGRYPDKSFALIAAVDRSASVNIVGVDETFLREMPLDAKVTFGG
ncbi:LysR family transcriptional regulator [Sulfitobacter dubius]|uniref:LysR family transcriptional regulator n=1 Tax=Sulfitobacter dubius TaxID=218673 RepID=UPI002943092A|nr:LysR family transcriptional regulator [Sulfitobacter dubius]WOI27836.1 LysR family transcriptional regulator [Sulfitobacter dubius]